MINAWREGRFCNPPGREGSVYLSWAVTPWGCVRLDGDRQGGLEICCWCEWEAGDISEGDEVWGENGGSSEDSLDWGNVFIHTR